MRLDILSGVSLPILANRSTRVTTTRHVTDPLACLHH